MGGCALLTRQPLVQYAVRERLALRHLVQVSLEDVELGHLLYLLVAHQAELDALTVRLGEQAGVLLSPPAAHILRGPAFSDRGSRVSRISADCSARVSLEPSMAPPTTTQTVRFKAAGQQQLARSAPGQHSHTWPEVQ